MNTRIAQKSDIKAIREMWKDYYGLSQNFCDWFFNRAFYSQNSIVVTEDDTIAASSGFIPYQLSLGEKSVSAAYIAGTVTLPEYASEAFSRQLLADTLLTINSKDIPISFLIPHKYSFYEKYGFRICYSFKQYTLTPEAIPGFSVRHRIERHKISPKIIEELNGIYERYMTDKNGYVIRDEEAWKLILEDLTANFGGKTAIAYNKNAEACGYILYVVHDGIMGIYEMAYDDRITYESLMGYIKGHELSVGKITVKTDMNDLSYLDFCDNRNPIAVYPFVMARINNVKEALLECAADIEGTVKLGVVDRLLEDNNRTFCISKDSVEETSEEPEAVADIGTLTMLLFGYISPEEAMKQGLLTGNIKAASVLFEKKNNFINMLYF